MTVFCDNGDCCYVGEDGFCGCDKLSIVGGVCAGSYRSGRNACDGDVDEQLKAENEKLIVKLNAEHIARQNAEVENAKLREERDTYRDLVGYMVHPDIPDQLAAENDKLRELVHAMEPFLCCMPFASCNTLAANVRKRMSELGMEVES